jgi:hypothetical protein
MREFMAMYVDCIPGMRDKLIASGIKKTALSDYVRGKGGPAPKKLWHICFVISVINNECLYDILLTALHLIEREMTCQDHNQKTLPSDKKQRR